MTTDREREFYEAGCNRVTWEAACASADAVHGALPVSVPAALLDGARDEALVKGETTPQDVPRFVFWALLLNAWPPLFDKVARDFRSLIRDEERKQEREAAMMGGMMP